MGLAPPIDQTCSCPNPISTISDIELQLQVLHEKLRQFEVAKVQEAPTATSFFLQTEAGVFIWSCISNVMSSLFLICVLRVCCKLDYWFGFSTALLQISDYIHCKGLTAAADLREGANALASQLGVRDVTEVDIDGRNKEMSLRKLLRKCLRWKQNRSRADMELPVTNSEALSTTASSPSPARCSMQPSTPLTPKSPDTNHDVPVLFIMHLPNTTVPDANDLQTQAATCLPSNTQDYSVESGSTFLSATVYVATSAMDNLLQHARCLLKMGCDLDAACTVQLGNTAILYHTTTGTGGENYVETKLLKEGVHDVPIITSAQKIQDRTIVIKGSYLEDTEIKATTSIYGGSIDLLVLYHQKLENGVEMLLAQLPIDKTLNEKIMVHAIKTIQMEGCSHPLVLRCKGKEVDFYKQTSSSIFGTLHTTQFWICFLVLFVYQATRLQHRQWLLAEGIFQFIIFLLSYFLVEYIIGPWTFGMIAHWIEIKKRNKNLYNILKNFDRLLPKGRASLERDMNNATNTRQEGRSIDVDDSDAESSNIEPNVQRVNSPDWEWPCYERFLLEGKWVTTLTNAKKEITKWPFEVVTTVSPKDGKESVELIVRSPLLVQVLRECEPKTAIHIVEGSRIRAEEIFLRRDSLESYFTRNSHQIDGPAPASAGRGEVNEAQSMCVWYVKHLLRFIKSHFAVTLGQYESMKREECVSFEMLWAFFVPGEGVCRRCNVTNQQCYAIVKRLAMYRTDHMNQTFCHLMLNVMDFNVQSYHRCTMEYKIPAFDGVVPFTDLKVCPLQFFSNRKEMEAHFIFMGNFFYQVAMQQPFRFMHFKGSLNFFRFNEVPGCFSLQKLNADGRVMIDLLSFARMNADYPLENAEPPCEVIAGTWTPEEHRNKPADEELMLAPAFVYGFSFRVKQWGCFEMCGLQEITFSQGAFDVLKMREDSQKMVLLSMVKQYIVNRDGSRVQNGHSIDPIATKGTGCIVLCHGPPGTGKTLTAEALAEEVRCPLWSISAVELGKDPDEVEAKLTQIMEVAYTWGAVVLLDEADAYLERRHEGIDVKHNQLTGVFLRLLEYYRGIMFLTTNRVTAFDDAILSRTTLAISYPPLDDTQRRGIWMTALNRVGIHNVTYDALLHHPLNGREIRNVIHVAQLLAHASGHALNITHVLDALTAFIAGIKHVHPNNKY